MGFDIETFELIEEVPKNKDVLLISGLIETLDWLKFFNIKPPAIDYPYELTPWFSRGIMKTTLSELKNYVKGHRIFVKPYIEKQFSPLIIGTLDGLKELQHFPPQTEIWISGIKHYRTETRFYISDNKILGGFKYKKCKDDDYILDSFVQNIVDAYKNSPISYVIDLGVDIYGFISIVEINDGFCVENYGLDDVKYAQFILARWDELFL